MQLDFRLAVILLDSVLIGQRTTVQLQIKLTAVGCWGVGGLLQLLHKIPHPHMLRARAAICVTAAASSLNHLKLRAAAAVAKAVGEQPHIGNMLLAHHVALFTFHRMMIDALCIRPDMCFIEVGKHLRAVNSLPIKRIIWEGVGIIPLNFGCEKIIHTAAPHNLWDSSAVAKGIRQPETIGGIAEIPARKPLPPQKLPDHRLAGGDIAIAFHPNAAVWLIAAFPYALLHPFKKGRIIPADHLAVIGGALNKRIFRILLH